MWASMREKRGGRGLFCARRAALCSPALENIKPRKAGKRSAICATLAHDFLRVLIQRLNQRDFLFIPFVLVVEHLQLLGVRLQEFR